MLLEHSALTNYLKKYDSVYPGIEIWWEKRVVADVATGIKTIFRFDKNFEVYGLGVIDLKQGKLCHLSLEHAVRGSGLGKTILNLCSKELKYHGHNKLWCHGPEDIMQYFIQWSGAIPLKDLHCFGRSGGIKDTVVQIDIRSINGLATNSS